MLFRKHQTQIVQGAICHVFTLFNLQGALPTVAVEFHNTISVNLCQELFSSSFRGFYGDTFETLKLSARFHPARSRSPSAVQNFFTLAHLLAFVKNFFTFFNVFCSQPTGFAAPQQVPAYIIKKAAGCQPFFHLFFKLFSSYYP